MAEDDPNRTNATKVDCTASAKPDPIIGKEFGNYRAIKTLGEGGMGTVYELLHDRIGKRLALKVLHRRFTEEQHIVRRFFDEARAVNMIGQPNIVDIIDCNHLEDGTPYLTMEYLSGRSLWSHLREQGTLELDEIERIFLPLCSALGAAHEKGIVHRDLKPDNIHLVEPPIHVKILDFGIAKLQEDTLPGGSGRTKSGIVLGTPRYMSPEQSMGRTHLVDHRTDIYALGIILYQMIAGKTPFSAPSMGDLLLKHLQDDPPPLGDNVPTPWKQVVLIALAKKREHRFQSMEEFARAIRTAQSGGDVLSVCPPVRSGNTRTLEPSPVAEHQLNNAHQSDARFVTTAKTDKRWGVKRPLLLISMVAALTIAAVFVVDDIFLRTKTQPFKVAGVEKSATQLQSPLTVEPTTPAQGRATLPRLPTKQADELLSTTTTFVGVDEKSAKTVVKTPAKTRVIPKSSTDTKAKRTEIRKPRGKLVIKGPWAAVKVDGKKRGYAPKTFSLSPGYHRISLSAEGKSKTIKVKIGSGKTKSIRYNWDE